MGQVSASKMLIGMLVAATVMFMDLPAYAQTNTCFLSTEQLEKQFKDYGSSEEAEKDQLIVEFREIKTNLFIRVSFTIPPSSKNSISPEAAVKAVTAAYLAVGGLTVEPKSTQTELSDHSDTFMHRYLRFRKRFLDSSADCLLRLSSNFKVTESSINYMHNQLYSYIIDF